MLQEDIEVVVVSCRKLCEKVGVGWARGVGKRKRGSASKRGRGYRRRRGIEVRGRSGRRGGGRGGRGRKGRGQAGGSAERGVECQHALGPIDAGIVALQPRKPQHKLEVAKSSNLEGECLCVSPMNAEMRGKVVGNATSGRDTAIDEFHGDRGSVGRGCS